MALLKMLQVVIGDRKRKSQNKQTRYGLRYIGQKHGWGDLAAPGHIAKYLGAAVKYEIWQSHKREQTARKHTIAYLLVRHSGWQGSRIVKQDEIGEEEQIGSDSGPCVAFHEETPDRIVAGKEALEHALASGDIFDRLLLTMKRENLLTEEAMGEQVGLDRDEVNRRLSRIREAMETDLELSHNGQSKRAAKKPPPVLSINEALDWPGSDLFDQLLTLLRQGVLTEVEMAARLGWTRDQVQRRLQAMRGNGNLLDALFTGTTEGLHHCVTESRR